MDIIEHTRRPLSPASEQDLERGLVRRLERWATRPGFAWGLLVLTLLVTGLAWWVVRTDAQLAARARFERQASTLQHRLAQSLARHEDRLQTAATLIATTPAALRRQIGQRPSSPQAWAQTELGIVLSRPPRTIQLGASDCEVSCEPERRVAMESARDSGEIRLTGAVTLQPGESAVLKPGHLLYAPVYHPGPVPTTQEQRRERLLAWVYTTLPMDDLLRGLRDAAPDHLSVELLDGDFGTETLLSPRQDAATRSANATAALTHTLPMAFAGRSWTLVARGEAMLSDGGRLRMNLVGYSGLVLNALVLWMVLATMQRKRRSDSDVAARRQDLLSRTAWLDAVSGLSPDGVLVFEREPGEELRLVFTNPAFSQLFGLRPEDLLGLTEQAVDEWLSGLDDPRWPHQALGPGESQVALAGPPPQILHRRCREEGLRRVYYFKDVTRESEVERMKSEFLTTAAHELRTPLSSVYGYSELLLNPALPADKRQRVMEIVHRQAGVLRCLVDELLDLARLDARGPLDLTRTPADLRDVALVAVESFTRPGAPTRIHTSLPPTALPVRIDTTKVQQAIMNALSNALKYSPAGQPVRLILDTVMRAGQPCAQLQVEDEGIGMDDEQCARAFERFYRADPSGHIAGAGLGLSIVQEIMSLHGGEVALRSQPGQGTTLTLYLPLEIAPLPAAAPVCAPAEAAELTS